MEKKPLRIAYNVVGVLAADGDAPMVLCFFGGFAFSAPVLHSAAACGTADRYAFPKAGAFIHPAALRRSRRVCGFRQTDGTAPAEGQPGRIGEI